MNRTTRTKREPSARQGMVAASGPVRTADWEAIETEFDRIQKAQPETAPLIYLWKKIAHPDHKGKYWLVKGEVKEYCESVIRQFNELAGRRMPIPTVQAEAPKRPAMWPPTRAEAEAAKPPVAAPQPSSEGLLADEAVVLLRDKEGRVSPRTIFKLSARGGIPIYAEDIPNNGQPEKIA